MNGYQDGRIVLPDGMNYRLLVLPNQSHIPVEVLETIAAMVKDGAAIVGPKPTRDPRLGDQPRRTAQVRQLAEELWGGDAGETLKGRTVVRGRVFAGITPTQVLAAMNVTPDFRFTPRAGGPVADFIHRRIEQTEVYFVRNAGTNGGMLPCHFRVHGLLPQLWDPVTGQTGIQVAFKKEADGISMDLPLAPAGSIFVVFQEPSGEKAQFRLAQPTAETMVSGPWTLRFPAGWGAPPEIQMQKLQSWADFTEGGIHYFSGTAVYHKTLNIPAAQLAEGRRIYLDLGRVRDVAEVFLNGRLLNVAWQPPFRIDLTPAARPGRNELKIAVTNLWSNRLCGDTITKGKRYTNTNANTQRQRQPWTALPSGLLGPVRLLEVSADAPPPCSPTDELPKDLPVAMPIR